MGSLSLRRAAPNALTMSATETLTSVSRRRLNKDSGDRKSFDALYRDGECYGDLFDFNLSIMHSQVTVLDPNRLAMYRMN